MASSNSSLAAKSCACAYIAFLAGIFSWCADNMFEVLVIQNPTKRVRRDGAETSLTRLLSMQSDSNSAGAKSSRFTTYLKKF
jgi:hypothetical protein